MVEIQHLRDVLKCHSFHYDDAFINDSLRAVYAMYHHEKTLNFKKMRIGY